VAHTHIIYDAAGAILSQAVIEAQPRVLSQAEFLDLFTDAEIAAAAALRDTTLASWWEKYWARAEFHRDAALTSGALDALTLVGVLAAGRKAGVLAAWPVA